MSEVFLIVGLKKSGVAAARLLLDKGRRIVLYDGKKDMDAADFFQKNPSLKGQELYLEILPDAVKKRITTAVLSPGVPLDIPFVEDLKASGIRLIGEVELAYTYAKGEVAAITGTNGKTTTTALVGELLKRYFSDVHVVGNIGIPYTEEALKTKEDSVTVAEISSFQLETICDFAPKVSAILNITPDHLNRHHTMEAYIAAKEEITKNQGQGDVCVLNYGDAALRAFGESIEPKVVWFFGGGKPKRDDYVGYYYEDGIIFRYPDEKLLPVSELQILGVHNYENAMAAIAVSEAMGVPMEEIKKGLREFTAVEHRIEFTCEKRGVRFYNDSKGTNPDAAIKGIQAMDRPTCLIGGGYDKDSSYEDWIDAFGGKVKKLVLIGETKEKIAAAAKSRGFLDFCFADTLEEAIDICYGAALDGDAVLLSPACASWDMFPNYEERGRLFKEYARGLKE